MRVFRWVLGIVVGVPVVLVLLVLVVANSGPGQRLIEREAGSLSGGMVVISGLGGRLPDALRLAHLEVRDARGVWLSADDVLLDWSPWALVGRTAKVQRLSVARLAVPRLPVAAAPAKTASSSSGFSLPVQVDVRSLEVARVELGAPVAGAAVVLKLSGSGHVVSLQEGTVSLAADRLDSAGLYRVDGSLTGGAIAARVTADEPAGGLVSQVAKLPALGALSVAARVAGPRDAERADVTALAGPLRLGLHGTVDLVGSSAAVDLTAQAPAMRPRADVAWSGIDLAAHVHGPFSRPDAAGHLTLTGVEAGGAAIASVVADVSGNAGAVDLHAVLTGTRLPGPKPELFAGAPLDLTGHVQLDQAARPVRFKLVHTLLTAEGTARTGVEVAADVHVVVPDIAPLAAIGRVDLRGSTDAVARMAVHGEATDFSVDGTADFTGGQAPVPELLGATKFAAVASMQGQDIVIKSARVDGRAVHADVSGVDRPAGLDLGWHVGLTDLSALSAKVVGALQAAGHVSGPTAGLTVAADIRGDVGGERFARGPVSVRVRAEGVPGSPSGTVDADGVLAGSKLALNAAVRRAADGALQVVLKQASWRSFGATADLALPKGASLPVGRVDARMTRLADLSEIAGQDLAGAFTASVVSAQTGGRAVATVDVRGSGIAVGGRQVGRLTLAGRVVDPATAPNVALNLVADGIAASGITGAMRASVNGPAAALAIRADAGLHDVGGADASFATQVLLDAVGRQAVLQALRADYKGETLVVQAPARVAFGSSVSVDRLALGLGAAQLRVAGRVSPTLDLTASLRNVTPDLVRPFAPGVSASGVLSADARLTGSTAAPSGQVRVQASGLRMRSGPAAAVPAAQILATIGLNGGTARVDGRVDAGPRLHLSLAGTAPLKADGALALRAGGRFDLTLLDPVLEAGGRRARGMADLDLAVSGSVARPRVDGGITLAGGEIQDFAQGLHITDIGARIDAAGDTFRIARFSGKAGPGTIAVSGSVGALAPGIPVDLHVTARRARPLASDLLTAEFDADIAARGQAAGTLAVGGTVQLHRAEINIPDSLPPSVAVLHVRRPGDRPPAPPSGPAAVVNLDLKVDAPGSIFVRGHGLDAELGGTLHVGGTSAAPQVSGGFDMRRGAFSLAGTTLNFSKGRVGFNGAGVANKIDPTLDFEADSYQGGITATLKVTGYADAPKIGLSSTPDLPQDEVLAHLLFGQSMKSLSALQIAEIGAALAELSGVTGGGGGPLAAVRKGLGLDELSVGGGTNGAGASVQAGRYVAKGVFVGAKQATGGSGGTQAQVRVDLTRHLKLQTTLGTGGGSTQGATPENDPGSSVGLSYQFEY